MWNGDAGDYIWDFITELVNDEKKEEEVKNEVMYVLNTMIKRNEKELVWLKKIKKMIELEKEDKNE